jgi:hypothetical protein
MLRTRALLGHPGRFALTYTLGWTTQQNLRWFGDVWCPHSLHLLPEEHCSAGWHLLFGSIAQLRCSAAER